MEHLWASIFWAFLRLCHWKDKVNLCVIYERENASLSSITFKAEWYKSFKTQFKRHRGSSKAVFSSFIFPSAHWFGSSNVYFASVSKMIDQICILSITTNWKQIQKHSFRVFNPLSTGMITTLSEVVSLWLLWGKARNKALLLFFLHKWHNEKLLAIQ